MLATSFLLTGRAKITFCLTHQIDPEEWDVYAHYHHVDPDGVPVYWPTFHRRQEVHADEPLYVEAK